MNDLENKLQKDYWEKLSQLQKDYLDDTKYDYKDMTASNVVV